MKPYMFILIIAGYFLGLFADDIINWLTGVSINQLMGF